MVPKRNDVNPEGIKVFCDRTGNSQSCGSILRIGDAKVNVVF